MRPIQTAPNGRSANGRFAVGNRLARGNGIGRKTARFRAALFDSVTVPEFQSLARKLFKLALAGKPWPVKLAFLYLLGQPTPHDYEERVAALESRLGI
jgi:hypothetical protein